MMLRNVFNCSVFLVAWCLRTTCAQEIKVETIVEGLKNPTSVVVQPGTGHVFVAESGALRVIRVVDGKSESVVTDFAKKSFGTNPVYDVGPVGLLFIDQQTLLVGDSGLANGDASLNIFKIPEAGAEAIKAEKIEGESKSLAATADAVAEGSFFGLAMTSAKIFVTCRGDETKSWVGLATLADGKLGAFTRSIELFEPTKVSAPMAITLSPDGYLAVGLQGTANSPGDSVLVFCDPQDGKILKHYLLGIHDITGLAYGPKQGRLFATDFNQGNPLEGALVKVIGTAEGSRCQEMQKLERPTSLAFSPEGDLYITLAGNPAAETPDGKLIRIKGLDEAPKKEGE